MVHRTGQSNKWQTNDRGHSGLGEAWGVCNPSVTLGTAYPQVVVMNSLLSQDAVSHGADSMSSCPFSPPAHFSSEEEFTICASGVPCFMQGKPEPHPYSTCITCNVMADL